MSKERAQRRAQGLADSTATSTTSGAPTQSDKAARIERAKAETARARETARRDAEKARRRKQRQQRWRSLLPWQSGPRYRRRNRAQQIMVVATLVLVLGLIWVLADNWGVRVGLSMMALIATPALVTLALDKASRR